jgi:hypothetical protein
MEHADFSRLVEERLRRLGAADQDPAMAGRGGPQVPEFLPQIAEHGCRLRPRRVQPRRHSAQDAARLVVLAVARHLRQGPRPRRAFQQQRTAIAFQKTRRSLSAPPFHHIALEG